jgi:DNA-3-methyladenine glycosylase
MSNSNLVGREFYSRNTLEVARQMLGKCLVRIDNDRRLAGLIVECEAYQGEIDQGCHARAGLTPRTRVMFGPPGHAYVYFTYGMHWMLNFVTEPEGYPAAVLLRAVWATEGVEVIARRRQGQPRPRWTDGPAKVCQAFDIDKRFNGTDLCAIDSPLFLENGLEVPEESVTKGPRVGLNSVPEPWKSKPWRIRIKEADIQPLLRTFCPVNLEDIL